ncbi:hypothetical protein [Pandoraea sp. ISTKB]|uniref:hypothetical protein n=1 Tax=Pandoraea sp. ISTKB TaxID=1586708 RepID=UPI00084669A9|nr:hypothetical protein [Pandoraea sp. ISTKB]
MLISERRNLADRIVAFLGEMSPEFGPSVLGPSIASRILALFSGFDSVVHASSQPVLFAELLPGVDVIGVRDYTVAPRGDAMSLHELHETWDQATYDSAWMEPLCELAQAYLKRQAQGVKGAGALSHGAADGTHYFVFQSEFRAMALRQLGLDEAEIRLSCTESTWVRSHRGLTSEV